MCSQVLSLTAANIPITLLWLLKSYKKWDKVPIQDLANNKEVLDERRKNLEAIHQTSAKIKDMSDAMAKQLDEQGAILDDIEANVITAEDNAAKAKEEIKKADEMSR